MNQEYDFAEMTKDLFSLLRLRITPIGIKALEKEADIDKIPRCRRAKAKHTACQFLGQAMNLGYTIAMVSGDNPIAMCEGLHGLRPQDDEWKSGQSAVGVWYATPADGKAHLDTYPYIPHGKYEAIVASPLNSGKLEKPDVCMVVGLPGQIFILLAGFLRHDYKPLDTPIIGESSCSQHWIRTLMTGKPNVSLPCFAEMRFAQYPDDCVIFTCTPKDLKKAIDGTRELNKIGLRYPIPGYGVMADAQMGHDASYKK